MAKSPKLTLTPWELTAIEVALREKIQIMLNTDGTNAYALLCMNELLYKIAQQKGDCIKQKEGKRLSLYKP